jgi:hypothetical protein
MLFAEYVSVELQGFLMKFHGIFEPSLELVGTCQVVKRHQGIRVLGTKGFPAELETFLEQWQGIIQTAYFLVGPREIVHAVQRVGVCGAELFLAEIQGFLKKLDGLVLLAGFSLLTFTAASRSFTALSG